jgi:chromosome segregation ATPase
MPRRRSAVRATAEEPLETEVLVPRELYRPLLGLLAVAGMAVVGGRIMKTAAPAAEGTAPEATAKGTTETADALHDRMREVEASYKNNRRVHKELLAKIDTKTKEIEKLKSNGTRIAQQATAARKRAEEASVKATAHDTKLSENIVALETKEAETTTLNTEEDSQKGIMEQLEKDLAALKVQAEELLIQIQTETTALQEQAKRLHDLSKKSA